MSKVFEDENSHSDQYSLKKQMHMVGNCILKTRRLSAQEAAARLGHLKLVWSSRSVVFLNTRPKQQRYKMLLPKSQREN